MASITACFLQGSGGTPPPPPSPDAGLPFLADPPNVYVAKVKNVLVGLPPTAAEVSAVESDPTQLGSLVDGWMQLPQYDQKMMRFFELAFQQTQVIADDFNDQRLGLPQFSLYTAPQLLQNLQESFARTMVMLLLSKGRPLSVGMTTTQYMMTTAMKEVYAYLDWWGIDDQGQPHDFFRAAYPKAAISIESDQSIPIEQTADPTSTNFMQWYDPGLLANAGLPAVCRTSPVVYAAGGPSTGADTIQLMLYGTLRARKLADGTNCQEWRGTAASAAVIQPSDFTDWQLVTVRPPNSNEQSTPFWDLAKLRQASGLVLRIPRVGFFSTPAFFANWQTNASNQMRVTANQALIVATESSIDGTDSTSPLTTPGLDTAHASQAACSGCHKLLDPTRSIFAATYSWNYHPQTDTSWSQQPGLFAFQGVVQPVHDMTEFGNTLASHPLLPTGWAQKLCYYVNSAPCAAEDVQGFADAFQRSSGSWNALVKAVVTSPVTTHAASTATTQANGEIIAVSRRDHLCAALNARLGFTDVCGLDPTPTHYAKLPVVDFIVSGLPSDGYGRGAPVPVLPTQPTLFYRAATENICENVAPQVIDNPNPQQGVTQWSSTQPDAAIADFVSLLMGLTPSDPRSSAATAVLKSHFTSAMAQAGITPTAALESTFVAACLSPSLVSIGM